MSDAYLTRAELARELKVHPTTVDRWRRAGMPSELWGPRRGTRRFPLKAALRWAKSAAPASVPPDQKTGAATSATPADIGG